MIYYYVTFGLLLTFIIGYLAYERFKKPNPKLEKIVFGASIAYFILYLIGLFFPDSWQYSYRNQADLLNENRDVFISLCRLFSASLVVVLPVALKYKKPVLTKIVGYVLLPFALVNFICFFRYWDAFSSTLFEAVFGEGSKGVLQNLYFRATYFGLEQLASIGASVYLILHNYEQLRFSRSLKEVLFFLLALLGSLYVDMPVFFPQMLTGSFLNALPFARGTLSYYAWIIAIIAEAVGFSFLFRKREYDDKYIVLLIAASSLLLQYSTYLASNGLLRPDRFPLQLCNVAVYLIFFAILLKNEKLYHFALVANVIGAAFAVILCDSNTFTAADGTTYFAGVFYCRNVGYIFEHTKIIVLPLLCATLKMFKPLKIKDVWHPIIGFLVYDVVALAFGTLFNGLEVITGDSYWDCNYLFMFKASVAKRLMGSWTSVFYNVGFSIGSFQFYLGELIIIFIFEALMIGGFFAMYPFFRDKTKPETPALPQNNS
jgi:hypothetical protein